MREFNQVETTEIDDSDLDSISGGLTLSAGPATVSVEGVPGLDAVQGVVGTATSALSNVPVVGGVASRLPGGIG